ncbi:MAG TPA: signal peptidase II [Anaerolineae bacterium]|nr:signal peptidase II [Anaerolineae bacterium]
MRKVRDYLVLLGIAGGIVALDQWTKYLVRSRLAFGEAWSPWEWLMPYARIVHWNNTGAAFGLFPAAGVIFTIVAILVSVAIIYYYPRVPKNQIGVRIALPMQLAGALGNLIDRLSIGTVTDFVSLGAFPVFNVADASISIGVAVLVVVMFLEDRRTRRQVKATQEDVDETEEEGSAPEEENSLG